jgi:hypothetical protein
MSTLPARAPATLAEQAVAIRILGKRVVGDIVEIGQRLTICHGMICGPRGKHTEQSWPEWLKREFEWSEDTATRYMQLAEFSSSRNLRDDLSLPVSGLYLLAAPSTPEEARAEVIERAEQGEKLSVKDVQTIVDKSRKQPASKPKAEPKITKPTPDDRPIDERVDAVLVHSALMDLVQAIGTIEPETVAAGVWPDEVREVRDEVETIRNWLDRFVTLLPKDSKAQHIDKAKAEAEAVS